MPNFFGNNKLSHSTEACCVPSGPYRDKSLYLDDASDLLGIISMQSVEKQIHVRLEQVVSGARDSEVSTDELVQRINQFRQIVQLHQTLTLAKEEQK